MRAVEHCAGRSRDRASRAATARWDRERSNAETYEGFVAAAFDAKRHEVVYRDGRTWGWQGPGGRVLRSDEPSGDRFHVQVHDVAIAPNASYVAAAEGEWGGSSLVLRALP